ncbi:hypothetical protein WJX72_010833 [[Myrmecia] bisecta]|uniref:c-Myc-binding protein n=1 Tax=[Myrmecia] bisecta TaxID=41462 RepID=A0AAW1QGE4_9CHLO
MAATKKEAYRKYLESAGVLDVMTKVLVGLYEEPDKPKDATEYIKAQLGAPTAQDFAVLQAEKDALQRELDDARKQIDELKAKVTA